MARKHAKKFSKKQPVERILIKNRERICTEVPEGTEGALAINQGDGSTKWFLVTSSPTIYKVVATGPTTTRSNQNDPKNMAPKGSKMSKSGPANGGKK